MSTPPTLTEAFRILGQRRKKTYTENEEGTNDAVDILGIVTNISTDTSSTTVLVPNLSSRRHFVSRSRIWLVDDSRFNAHGEEFPQHLTSASFFLYGSSEIDRIHQENIKAGDIVRFNRVSLKEFDPRGLAQFRFSSYDHEPGVNWFRLGHIDKQGCFNENSGFHDNNYSPTGIPTTMKTSKGRIAELASWYNKHYHLISRLSTTSNIALPTRRRLLSEIQFTSGVLSNVRVKVTQVDLEPARSAAKNISYRVDSSRKKKRSRMTLPPTAFAVFTDESGVLMPFIDTSGRFVEILRSSKNADHNSLSLLMTNVSTEYQSNLRGLETVTSDIVLVPTRSTSGLLVSDEKNSNPNNGNHTDGISDSDVIQTQETMDTDAKREHTVISRLMDLCLNGISLKKNSQSVFSIPSKYLEAILDNRGKSFRRNAMVHLDTSCCSLQLPPNNTSETVRVFEAKPGVLKTLCGSLEVEELSNDEMLCDHSMRFLRTLVQEDVVLKWTLVREERKQNVAITKVVLHRIPRKS